MNSNKQEITPSKNGLRWFEEATKSRYLSPKFDIHQIAELANIINRAGLTKRIANIIKNLIRKQCTTILSNLLPVLKPDKIYRHSNPHTTIHYMDKILKTFNKTIIHLEKNKDSSGGSFNLAYQNKYANRRQALRETYNCWKNWGRTIEQKENQQCSPLNKSTNTSPHTSNKFHP